MSNFQNLTELEDAILRYIQDQSPAQEDVFSRFTSKTYPKVAVKNHIKALDSRSYIKLSDRPVLKAGFYSLDASTKDEDLEYIYEITELGKGYLARSTSNFTSFSNISNSNIAHQSPNAKQYIKITEQPQDIQEKIKELELAIIKKDSSAMKKAFGYIADKAVDVAVALATGALLR